MAEKNKIETVKNEVIDTTDSNLIENAGLQAVVNFFNKYKNFFYIGAIAILLGVLAYTFLGKNSDPVKTLKADAQVQNAVQMYMKDSFEVALNGDANGPGLLSIINKNKGTSAANIARVEAAMCYLKTNRPKDAIKQLEAADGFGKQINAKRLSLLGDANSELATEGTTVNTKLADVAIDFYEKAANSFPEDEISAVYLFRAAQLQEKMGKNDAAKKNYLTIKEKYPDNTFVMKDVEKYLGKLGVIN